MRVNRAKRRWMAWQRYVLKTKSRTTHKNTAGIHSGYAWAYRDAMFAGRAFPMGVRAPWMIHRRKSGT